MKAIILAAGCGSRLHDHPTHTHKILIKIGKYRILDWILGGLDSAGIPHEDIIFVVGWEANQLLHCLPNGATFAWNARWATTNTAASLRLGMQAVPAGEDFMIINGDVVAESSCFASVAASLRSAALCSIASTGDEEVKYRLTNRCELKEVSKETKYGAAVGEVMGINKVIAADREKFELVLGQLDSKQFYDVAFSEIKVYPVFLLGRRCIEIDTPEDLNNAREMFSA